MWHEVPPTVIRSSLYVQKQALARAVGTVVPSRMCMQVRMPSKMCMKVCVRGAGCRGIQVCVGGGGRVLVQHSLPLTL